MNRLVSDDQYKDILIQIIDKLKNPDYDKFRNYLLDNNNFTDNHHTRPKSISLKDIKDVGEKAFQRALINASKTYLDFIKGIGLEEVEWLDGELPIVLNKNPRRMSIDLYGHLEGVPVLCELKFNSKKDSPEYAVVELLTYYYIIRCNAVFLDKWEVYHTNQKPWVSMSFKGYCQEKGINWQMINDNGYPRLIVAANKQYWDHWLKNDIDRNAFLKKSLDWAYQLDTNLNIFQTEDFDFKSQKGTSLVYTPSIPKNNVWTILK